MPLNSEGRCTNCGSFYCSICAKWLDNDFKIGTDAPALPTETGTRKKRPKSILEW
jgi:hypothetical protein